MVAMTLPAGHVADTRERKRVIILMQGVLALTSLGLAFVSWKEMPVAWIYICLFVVGAARTFVWSASASFLPQLVQREEFPLALNWSSSTFQFSAVTGPAAGGALIALTRSAATVYTLNALAAIFCLAMICLVRAKPKPVVKQEVSMKSLLGGFSFVFGHRVILGAITLDLFAVLFGGGNCAVAPAYAEGHFKGWAAGTGFVDGGPAGRLDGLRPAHGPSPSHEKSRARLHRTLGDRYLRPDFATVAFGWSRWFWFSVLMLFICGFVDNVSVIVRHTLVQIRSTPGCDARAGPLFRQ